MKKYLMLLVIPAFLACGGGEKKSTPLEDSLSHANMEIKNELKNKEDILNTKEQALSEFLNSFNEIQQNLNEIKEKEKIISENTGGKDMKKSNKDVIINDIHAIYDLLNKNQKKVATLNKRLKESNLKIDEIQLAMTNLTSQVEAKETEITDLKAKLEKLNVDLADLNTKYVEEREQSEMKTEKLNTAFYVVSTKKDLADKGIITKKGGFIGMGKVVELSPSLDPNYFTKIDITTTKEITIHGDKVKVVSSHPANSYQLIEGSASIDKIVILDPDKFWSISKYLIIEKK